LQTGDGCGLALWRLYLRGDQEDAEKRAEPPHPTRRVYSCQESSTELDMLGRRTEECALTRTEIVALAKQSGSP
jgi:hypothetical protein